MNHIHPTIVCRTPKCPKAWKSKLERKHNSYRFTHCPGTGTSVYLRNDKLYVASQWGSFRLPHNGDPFQTALRMVRAIVMGNIALLKAGSRLSTPC